MCAAQTIQLTTFSPIGNYQTVLAIIIKHGKIKTITILAKRRSNGNSNGISTTDGGAAVATAAKTFPFCVIQTMGVFVVAVFCIIMGPWFVAHSNIRCCDISFLILCLALAKVIHLTSRSHYASILWTMLSLKFAKQFARTIHIAF